MRFFLVNLAIGVLFGAAWKLVSLFADFGFLLIKGVKVNDVLAFFATIGIFVAAKFIFNIIAEFSAARKSEKVTERP